MYIYIHIQSTYASVIHVESYSDIRRICVRSGDGAKAKAVAAACQLFQRVSRNTQTPFQKVSDVQPAAIVLLLLLLIIIMIRMITVSVTIIYYTIGYYTTL